VSAISGGIFPTLDVVQILSYGVIGLGFFLALFSYNLLAREQKLKGERVEVLRSIKYYMGFSLILCVLGIAGNLVTSYSPSNQLTKFADHLEKERNLLEYGQTPEQASSGSLNDGGQKVLYISTIQPHTCKSVLAVTEENRESVLAVIPYLSSNQKFRSSLSVDQPSAKVETVCAEDEPIQVVGNLHFVSKGGEYSMEVFPAPPDVLGK
jgi:hypothetical protein